MLILLSIYRSIFLSKSNFICTFTCFYIYLFLYIYIYVLLYLYIYFCFCSFVSIPFYLSIYMFNYSNISILPYINI